MNLKTLQVEILESCNFRCSHCFIDGKNNIISFNKMKIIIDKAKKEGFSVITLTGGECLTHPEFKQIYEYIYDNNFLINVFTNGYLIDQHINTFRRKKPLSIELTMYGFDQVEFEDFVNKKVDYIKVVKNIKLLQRYNIKVVVKYNITSEQNALEKFLNFVDNNNLEYKISTNIFDCASGKFIIPFETKVIVESILKYRKYFDTFKVKTSINCEASESFIILRATLELQYCYFISDSIKIDMEKLSFNDYMMELKKMKQKRLQKYSKCFNCDNVLCCDVCISYDSENLGNECEKTEKRKRYFNENI